MAGWRKIETDEGDPVEIVDADDHSEVALTDGRSVDWHAVIRTGAAVVAALSLLWIGRSYADEARRADQQACLSDVQNAFWRYEQVGYESSGGRSPEIEGEVIDDLVAAARDCESEAYADALERTRPPDQDE